VLWPPQRQGADIFSSSPSSERMGRNCRCDNQLAEYTGLRTSRTAFRTVDSLCFAPPCSAEIRCTFSTWMMVASIIIPIEMASRPTTSGLHRAPHIHKTRSETAIEAEQNNDHGSAQTPQHQIENENDQDGTFQESSCDGPDAAGTRSDRSSRELSEYRGEELFSLISIHFSFTRSTTSGRFLPEHHYIPPTASLFHSG